MTPERNQPDHSQSGKNNSETSNTQPTSDKYRPDWIIPDNGSSSRANTTSERSNEDSDMRPGKTDIPVDNNNTLGIP